MNGKPCREGLLPFWIILTLIYLGTSGLFCYLAPLGYWRNIVFESALYNEMDPTAQYIVSSAYFFNFPQYSVYVGHPGLPLRLLVYCVINIYYLIHQMAGSETAYPLFLVMNSVKIFILSKVTMTAVHIASFYVLFNFARRIFREDSPALIATLGYATSLPVLYYISRVSTEPFQVIFFFLTVISLWTYQERAQERGIMRVIPALMCAAVFSISGFYTKVHILGLIPVFALVYIVVTDGEKKSPIGIRKRMLFSGCYSAFAAFFMYLGGFKVEWDRFFYYWFHHAPGFPRYDLEHSLTQNIILKIGSLVSAYFDTITLFFFEKLPEYLSVSKMGMFTLSESVFIVCGCIGFILFWKQHLEWRRKLTLPLLYMALTVLVFLIKGDWNYLFIPLAVSSVFFGYAVYMFIRRAYPDFADRRKMGWIILSVLGFHFVSIFAAVDSRITDIVIYRRTVRPYYEALNMVGNGERVAVLHHGENPVHADKQVKNVFLKFDPHPDLVDTLENVFLYVPIDMYQHDELFPYLGENLVGAVVYEPEDIRDPVLGVREKERTQAARRRGPKGPMTLKKLYDYLHAFRLPGKKASE